MPAGGFKSGICCPFNLRFIKNKKNTQVHHYLQRFSHSYKGRSANTHISRQKKCECYKHKLTLNMKLMHNRIFLLICRIDLILNEDMKLKSLLSFMHHVPIIVAKPILHSKQNLSYISIRTQ